MLLRSFLPEKKRKLHEWKKKSVENLSPPITKIKVIKELVLAVSGVCVLVKRLHTVLTKKWNGKIGQWFTHTFVDLEWKIKELTFDSRIFEAEDLSIYFLGCWMSPGLEVWAGRESWVGMGSSWMCLTAAVGKSRFTLASTPNTITAGLGGLCKIIISLYNFNLVYELVLN